jgi:hypothetical protein
MLARHEHVGQAVAADPAKLISDNVELSETDRAVMEYPERHEMIRRTINKAFRHGVWGYVDDTAGRDADLRSG